MADLKKVKGDIFGSISSFRTLVDDYPKLKTTNSFTSISNSSDPIDYITDLYKALGGLDDLQLVLSDILVTQLDRIELQIKETLKVTIKEFISCNIEPTLLKKLITNGINFSLNEIDFLNLMRKSPFDNDGDLFYFDITENICDSKDFNLFLYGIVNKLFSTNCSEESNKWGLNQDVWKNNIVRVTFTEGSSGVIEDDGRILSNFITIFVDEYYNGGNDLTKKLNEFNSDFIDSIKLFDSKILISKIIDKVFGVLSLSNKRTTNEILLESQIETILERISNCDDNTEIDDSYFSFSNELYDTLQRQAELRKIGVLEYNSNGVNALQISTENLLTNLGGFDSTTTLVEQVEKINHCIDSVVDSACDNNNIVNPNDKFSFKVNLIKSLIKELTISLTMVIMSPKVYILLLLNNKLLGINNPTSATDFISQNTNLIATVTQSIKDSVLDILMDRIVQMSNRLLAEVSKELIKEQLLKQKNYMLSLIPINI